MRTCIYYWKILLEVPMIENVRWFIGMERLILSWILHGNLQTTGEKKVIFKISLLKREVSKRHGSQFYIAAWICNQNAVFTRRTKWDRIWKYLRHWDSDEHGPQWLIMEICYYDFSVRLPHPCLLRLVDRFWQAVRQQKPWLSLRAQLRCTKTVGSGSDFVLHTKGWRENRRLLL